MVKKSRCLLLLLASIIWSGCDDPDCIRTAGDLISVGFYDFDDGTSLPVRINELKLIDNDSILVESVDDVIGVILPLNPQSLSISAVFDTEFGIDTLIVGYNTTTTFLSDECGSETIFDGIYLIRNDFDSARVVRKTAQVNALQPNVINENIQIFN